MNTPRFPRFAPALLASMALSAAPLLASGRVGAGTFPEAKAREILSAYVTQFTGTDATVTDAQGGWKGLGGAKPGEALVAAGAFAVGGHASVNGHAAEVVVAAGKGGGAARDPEGTRRALVAAGACGAMRVTLAAREFPASPEAAQALFDEVMGGAARGGYAFRYRKIAGTDVFGIEAWLPGPHGGKVRRGAWVSNYQGQTRVGVGAGTGLLARYLPRY